MRRLLLLLYLGACECAAQNMPAIQLNQVGFYPEAIKLAAVTGDVAATTFYVVANTKRDTVYRGSLSAQKQSAYSSTTTRLADFSALKKEGSYYLFVPGVGSSFSFAVSNHIHYEVAVATLKGFYFMRSDFPLDQKYAGKWHRPAGHPDTAVYIHPSAVSAERTANAVISTPGGWYDAGDYNKYIVNSGITMATLLSAYEDFISYFDTLKTSIPETGDAIPDILNELIYNLRWMLTMQDPNDGGVYHKCTNASFDGIVMPGVTKATRYVVPKSTAAALDFAAVTAQAARVLKKYKKELPLFTDSCLKASARAWQWAIKHPLEIYSQKEINLKFDPDITTGEYGDRSLNDEWMCAAAELFATGKERQYFDVIVNRMKDPVSLPSWSNVAMLGYYTIIRMSKTLPTYATIVVNQMKDTLLRIANEFVLKSTSNAFATIMGQSQKDFVWGSNAVAANQGVLLINAYTTFNDKKYLNGALSNLDYLLGRNATGYCFVTGMGSNPPMHPHHRPSEADGITDPVPGLLAGGPNPGRQDKCDYASTETERAYVDSYCSYASNEIAINWNAPIVYLANAIQVLYSDRNSRKQKLFIRK